MHAPDSSHSVRSDPHLPDWIDIMVHPRSAIERIVDTRTIVSAVVLHTLSLLFVFGAQSKGLMEIALYAPEALGFSPYLLLLSIPATIILAPIGLVLGAFILSVIGRLLSGIGDTRSLMMAVGWSNAPSIIGGALLSAAVFAGFALESFGLPSFERMSWIFTTVALGAGLYSFVLLTLTISEVHDFSLSRALLTVFLGPLLPLVVTVPCAIWSGIGG